REFGAFHIWNNIPSYRTEVRRDGEVIHTERIIVGKTSTQTPVFNDRMTHIVFKPEWGVPSSIKIKSLLPRLAGGDYDVLRRRGMRIALNGRSGDPRRINWSKRDIRTIPIVQGAGSSNPLGRMKFMFPNKHAVYMHDTPKRHLFKTRTRTHSAGCIRVRDPQRLAEILTSE
ncbi:MAG: L,D-transpeptidase family protein, partial [Pseudomonadota bacterium]